MHEYAEHGLDAHWLYKESENKSPSVGSTEDSEINAASYLSSDLIDESSIEPDAFLKYSSLKVGYPVLRVYGSQLLAATVIRIDNGERELLVAVGFGLAASEAVADRRSSSQIKRWEAYARLYKKQNQFDRLLPTFIQVINLTEREETEYWAVVSAVFEGKDIGSIKSTSKCSKPSSSTPVDVGINNKLGISIANKLLRTMLQWEERLRYEAGAPKSVSLGEVVIVCWHHGKIMRLSSSSTAASAARRVGVEGKCVSVNGMLVLPATKLKDGDVVEVRM